MPNPVVLSSVHCLQETGTKLTVSLDLPYQWLDDVMLNSEIKELSNLVSRTNDEWYNSHVIWDNLNVINGQSGYSLMTV